MLFHVTMTHSPDNCPLYLPLNEQRKFFTATKKMFEAARRLNVDIRFLVTGVGHVAYALVEADSNSNLNSFFGSSMPFKTDIQIEPVSDVKEALASLKKELARR